ncbi:MAG: 4-hydroxythreonine-4-phosphate dehydrogenase PdxA [Flavobacteriaceae bacterium]|jgi:4-hydroxythreonine-4-phosphate dehydrogenase|nr:4-hydroxythreonine-4-phosphate dehydrogenase PdxA [Flavobacteriaceae bacterium]MDG1830794.1 4-hydroxythreonine-4-phosphate dehydrogenase PdxA [Flavobacteriaceae bacterium]
MEEKLLPIVGISCGDPNGIGIEIILKSLHDKRILEFFTPVIFSNYQLLSSQTSFFNLDLKFNKIKYGVHAKKGQINVVNAWENEFIIEFGKSTRTSGEMSYKSLELTTMAIVDNNIDVMVTAPINKKNIQNEKFSFPGHTDYLSSKFNGESLMFMISERLKIGLLTDHVSINKVVSKINTEKIKKKISIMEKSLVMDFGIIKPKIGVLSINPHVGDGGIIGNEDEDILIPALMDISKSGTLVSGPYSSDSFFGSGLYESYDAILAIYHDQGLIPFKTLSFREGVNFTAGLDKIRTSPDHGTAYDIAGKNIADPASFKNAVFSAIDIYKNRVSHKKMLETPFLESKNKRNNK